MTWNSGKNSSSAEMSYRRKALACQTKTYRSFLNFVENTVVDERNLLEKWGPSTWSAEIVEK
jgi:hypothetical protein